MKKLFILAAAIIALASCSKDPETVINDGSIYFTNALTTRATTVTDAETLEEGFNVLGYAIDTKIFDNKEANFDGTKYWTIAPTQYWADNTEYNFFAAYPASNKFSESSTKSKANLEFTNDGSVDLVLAGRKVEVATKDRSAARLVFKHALSRVKFSFTNAYSSTEDGTDVKVTVSEVELVGENKTGTVYITTTENGDEATASSSKITWSDVESNNASINFAFDAEDEDGNKICDGKDIAEDATETTDYKYIIPTEEGNDTGDSYSLSCIITATDVDGNVIKQFNCNTEGNYIPLNVKKTGASTYSQNLIHEAGKSYTYTMNIKSDLNAITFTVAVEEWIEGVGGEIEFNKK